MRGDEKAEVGGSQVMEGSEAKERRFVLIVE